MADAIIQSELLEHKADNEQNHCQILSVQELSVISDRSNSRGLVQLAFHLSVMGSSGYLWTTNFGNPLVGITGNLRLQSGFDVCTDARMGSQSFE